MAKKISYRKFALSNGLTVILYPMMSVQSVFATLYVHTGAVYETKENNGISHFTEHWMHQGTKSFPEPRAWSEVLESQGIIENGGTGRFDTSFWIKSPHLKIKTALELLSELIFFPTLDQKRLEVVRQTIINEHQDFWRYPENQFDHILLVKRFPEQDFPYTYRSLGSLENIQKFDRQMVLDWRGQFYHPANMVLSIAGNFSERQISPLLKKFFGWGAKSQPIEEPKFSQGKYSNFLIYHHFLEREQVEFLLSFPAFGWKEVDLPERLALGLLGEVLGGGPVCRLFKVLREERGLVYSIGCHRTLFPWRGISSITGSTHKENLSTTFKLILEEVQKLIEKDVDSDELTRGKNVMNSLTSFRFESPESIANYLAGEEFDKRHIMLPKDYIATANQINKYHLKNVAKRIFDFSKLNIGLLGKVEDAEVEGIREIFNLS